MASNNQTLIVPQSLAPVLDDRGFFTTVWYSFFNALSALIPQVGDCMVQAVPPVSARYIECDGSAINRVQYKELFAVIGTTYGIGDGVTTFNLPNFPSPGAPGFWKIRFK